MKRWKTLLLVAAGALASLLAVSRWAARARSEFLSEPVRRGAIVESVYGIGTVLANRSYQVKPGVISTVVDLYVREGDAVGKGARIAKLDSVLLSAPFAGTITFLPYKVGENVFPGLPVLGLVDLTDRYVVVSLEQRAALRVRRGQKAKLSFETLRSDAFEGAVKAVYSNDGNFLVRIDAPSLPPQILPGMTVDVAIEVGDRRQALLLPVAAVEEGRVRVRRGREKPIVAPVKLGVVDAAQAELLSGDVREGDRLILKSKPLP